MTDKSNMPERLWTWHEAGYDIYCSNTHGDVRYTPKKAREYVRADLLTAAEDRVAELEAALTVIAHKPYPKGYQRTIARKALKDTNQ